MKIKTPFFVIEFEIMFIIVLFTFVFSNKLKYVLDTYFECYFFIIFHELSHMFIAILFGKKVIKFSFTLSGVSILLDVKGLSNIKKIMIYIAGPISNFILAFIFKENELINKINLYLGIINLFFIYPLDGYSILRIFFSSNICDKISKLLLFTMLTLSIFYYLKFKSLNLIIFFMYVLFINIGNYKQRKYSQIIDSLTY